MTVSIVPRAAWGAAPPRSVSRCAWTGSTLWVHHSTGPEPANTPDAERAYVKNIQAFHMGPQRGWSDIGYGYLIANASGRIYMGRGANVWAAHCPGHNDEPSVCIMGDFAQKAPSEAAKQAVWDLADHIGMTALAGHRQGFPTSCPGDAMMRSLVLAPRPHVPQKPPSPDPLPYSSTLRLVLNGRAWAGWDQAEGPLRWVAKNGLKTDAVAALAWRGRVFRGPLDVTNVSRNLVQNFL